MPSLLDRVRDALFLDTATDEHLTRLAGNYGVSRPTYNQSDSVLRKLVPFLGPSEKVTTRVIKGCLEAIYGKDSGIEFYDVVPNELVVVVPGSLQVPGDLASATYLHGDASSASTALNADAAPNDLVLTVVSTGSLTTGTAILDYGILRETVVIDSILTGTTVQLAERVRYAHKSSGTYPVLLRQQTVVPGASSYAGDFFGVPVKEGTLASGVSPSGTTATLNSGHTLPPVGVFVFEYDTLARREKFDCKVSGNTVSLIQFGGTHEPPLVDSFQYSHASGTKVTFFDKEGAALSSSADTSGSNPVLLHSDTRAADALDVLDLAVASGIVVRVENIG